MTDKHGSMVRFKADPTIFTETQVYDFETLNTQYPSAGLLK